MRLILLLVLTVIGSASCAKLLIPNNPLFSRLFEHGEKFVKDRGVPLEIVSSASLNSMAEEVRVDIGASSDPLNAYDAYCLKTTWVPELADAGLLENLIEYIRGKPQLRWSDVLPFAREYLSAYGRSTFVIPNDADFFFMAYRNDIFTKLEINSPETWEEFLNIAQRLNGTDMNNDGEGDFGACWATAQDAYFFPYWMAIASSIFQYDGTQQGILIDPDTNELLVSNEGFEYAANLHRNISRYSRSNQIWTDVSRDFLAGRCAMTINLPGGIKSISLGKLAVNSTAGTDPIMTRRAPGSDIVWDRQKSRLTSCNEQICKYAEFGRGGLHLINRSPFYGTGGWAFAIRKSADAAAKKHIFDFIAYVNEPEQSIRDVAAGTLFDTFRSSHLATDDVFLKSGWSLSRLQELRAITKDALDHPNAALDFSFPGQSELGAAFSTNLHGFLLGQVTLGKVKDHVLLAWSKLQTKYGNDKLRNFVRQSIGLSAIENKSWGPDIVTPTTVTCGVVLVVLIATCGLVRYYQHKLDSIWIIDSNEITYDDPVLCLGKGSAWSVFRAYYRGTAVAIKKACVRDFEADSSVFVPDGKDDISMQNCDKELQSAQSTANQENSRWSVAQEGGVNIPKRSLSKCTSSFSIFSGGASNVMAMARSEFITEMRLISQLRHPCITTVMGAIVHWGSEPALVVECMSNGSLRDLLSNQCVPLDTDLALPMLRDIVQGMRFLHAGRPPVVHGDLKSSNVLVDANFRAKVADFGISHRSKTGAVGSPYWMAPELLLVRGQRATKMSDVYAFGITVWEVLARREPYASLRPLYTQARVLEMVRDCALRPDIEGIQRQDLLQLMQECWAEEPSARPTFEALEARLLPLISQDVYSAARVALAGRSMNVLHDVFPRHVAEALIAGRKVEPEQHDSVTVYFSDIVGFTNISSALAPIEVSDMLHRLYTRLDAIADQHGVFKVETIGDAWMGVTNLVQAQPDHAARIARFALDAVQAARATHIRADDPAAGTVRIRVGFHSGPVVANVVGARNPRFCLFGDTVNTASRMESNSEELRIHCSEAAALLVMQQDPGIELAFRGYILIKGKGSMPTYWVERLLGEGEVPERPEPEVAEGSCSQKPLRLPIPFRLATLPARSGSGPGAVDTAEGCNDPDLQQAGVQGGPACVTSNASMRNSFSVRADGLAHSPAAAMQRI